MDPYLMQLLGINPGNRQTLNYAETEQSPTPTAPTRAIGPGVVPDIATIRKGTPPIVPMPSSVLSPTYGTPPIAPTVGEDGPLQANLPNIASLPTTGGGKLNAASIFKMLLGSNLGFK